MKRKNNCAGCVWGNRINEKTVLCAFGACIRRGKREDRKRAGAHGRNAGAGGGADKAAAKNDVEPVGGRAPGVEPGDKRNAGKVADE